jgi:5-methylthioadenosine/S-adenosylhomocysteine deaminase
MIETTEEALDRNRALLDYVASRNDPRLTGSVSFRGLSNASDTLIVGCKQLADEHGAMLQTHACFNYSTHDDCLANFGLPEIARLDALGVLDERVLLAHGGWLEPTEMGIVARRRPNFVAAPSSSLHNGYGNLVRGRLPELMELGVTVGIGSDHACSGVTDLVQELFLFAGTQQAVHMNPRVVAPEQAVEMATVNGARCAGLQQSIGSIEVGKAADVVLFDTATPEWQPLYNPVSNLVYSATGASVVDVFVAGEHVLRDGRLTTVDEADLLERVRHTSAGLRDRLDGGGRALSYWPVA